MYCHYSPGRHAASLRGAPECSATRQVFAGPGRALSLMAEPVSDADEGRSAVAANRWAALVRTSLAHQQSARRLRVHTAGDAPRQASGGPPRAQVIPLMQFPFPFCEQDGESGQDALDEGAGGAGMQEELERWKGAAVALHKFVTERVVSPG